MPKTLRWWACLFGFHVWDGHTGPDYPTPRCRFCRCFHDPAQRDREEALGWHDDPAAPTAEART